MATAPASPAAPDAASVAAIDVFKDIWTIKMRLHVAWPPTRAT